MFQKRVYGIVVTLLLLSSVALAFSIRHVRADPATITVPDDYLTIQEAINNADNGDTVFVRNGTYDRNIVVNKSLSLVGEDRNTTIIDGGGRKNAVVVEADNVVVSNFTIQTSDYACYFGVLLAYAGNSSVVNNNFICGLHRFSAGVYVALSPDSKVSGNYFYQNDWGILIGGSPNTLISHNIIEQSTINAIHISNSNGSTLFANCLKNNIYSGIRMDDVYDASVFCNDLLDSHRGIYLGESGGNLIRENNITRNWIGIDLCNSSGNLIFHNNFINNTDQVFDMAWYYEHCVPSMNTWDCGYPGGGNYWSDYNGSDLHEGPFQNVTGSDGIGDVPYGIDENNTDDYPFMNPHRSLHSISVDEVRPDRPIFGEGQTAKIHVDIANIGYFTETFNLNVYANTTIINQTEVTLTSVNAKTIILTWDTTGFAKGNYTITATASPVVEETCTSDNQKTCWVILSMIGDMTGPDGWPDGKVDMRDVGVAASAFGSYPGHPRWNPVADINQDNKVDMRDIGTVARHFGETDP